MFDGGSEVDLLEAVPQNQRTEAQTKCLEELNKEDWCRPCFPVRDTSGNVLSTSEGASEARESVYGKSISNFAVGLCPAYRRHGPLKHSTSCADGATLQEDHPSHWESLFVKDVRHLATEIFVHICGDSCHKYSGKKVQQICRHGFYHICNLGDWFQRKEGTCFRRRGKALANSLFLVKSTKHRMQGPLLMFQEQPFEVLTNYAGAASLRCNFDVQDLRRVLPESLWKLDEETLPTLRVNADG